MRICFPLRTNEGFNSRISGYFGDSRYFTIYDASHGIINLIPNQGAGEEPGQCIPFKLFCDHGVESVFCDAMGRHARLDLQTLGIKVFRFTRQVDTLKDAIEAYKKMSYEELTKECSCRHLANRDCGDSCHQPG